ncbi:hypothetical protein ACFXGR_22540 [Streptomyces mirabilis]|uniref:hypothetical protein n=1 Tax=Streptomyces mirabilis TaxID=68239 RepID=UPI0036C3A12D
MPAQPEPTNRAEIQKLANAVEEALAGEMQTSYRDDSSDLPSWRDGSRIGATPPVAQPDTRIAPQWAVGIAVASIGVGAGATGLGCAAWLAAKGLSMVSVPGLERFALIVIAPFAGVAMVLTAASVAIGKARKGITVVNNHGPVHVDRRKIRSKTTGVLVKNTNQQPAA